MPIIPVVLSIISSVSFYFWIPDLAELTVTENKMINETIEISGRISGPVHETDQKVDFIFNQYKTNTKYQAVYFKNGNNGDFGNFRYGAQCTVSGTPELPSTARNPGQFDYRKFLLSKGITHQLIIASLTDVECDGASLFDNLYEIRSNLIEYVTTNVSPATAAWMNALVLGEDSQLNEDTIALFQRWNLSHILAISGLHIGLIVGLVYFLLVKLSVCTKEKAQSIIICFLPVYAFLAGGAPSVWRASMMVVLFLLFSRVGLKISVTDVLSIVFLALIIFNRFIVYSVGFQLSFLVTFGLLLSSRWFLQSKSGLWTVLKISFVAQMLILPLQIIYFSNFHPLSILVNLVVVPYFSFIVIPFLFVMMLLSPLAIFTPMMDRVFSSIHPIVIGLISKIDQVAYFPFVIGSFSLFASAVYYLVYQAFMHNLQVAKLKHAFRYGCCLTLLIIIVAIRPYFSPVGKVTMLDVGQGDAMVIELPYRKGVIIIDAGAKMSFENKQPTDAVYQQIIKPFLYEKGIRKIDAVFISHADTDHMGSIPFLIKEMNVEKVIVSNYYEFDRTMLKLLESSDTPVIRAGFEEAVTVGRQSFQVLSPDSDRGTTNENSLVLYSIIGGKSWLFTGDIGNETEKDIISNYPDLTVDVLKVAHHGSDSSTDPVYLNQIQPTVAMISAGVNNSYGHPHDEVLTELEKVKSIIIRTDKKGAIQYIYEDDNGTFMTYLP
ncbi:DNA internalization-related competence protein ComEC/Rec2 [Virgibacillus siamensis]|uniref:DNA internalization-related competence protein ComEC/Rec2 n=2 Tax=Virgibacillus siamensis TaxID=480071 RepID=A0ABN1G159_9BACI